MPVDDHGLDLCRGVGEVVMALSFLHLSTWQQQCFPVPAQLSEEEEEDMGFAVVLSSKIAPYSQDVQSSEAVSLSSVVPFPDPLIFQH